MADEKPSARLTVLSGWAVSDESAGEPQTERRVTRRGAISRDRIIEAGFDLLAEGGYPALSISAVCKRAEVSAASLYHYFGDKAGLLAALIEESIVRSTRRFIEIVSDHESLYDQLEAYVRATKEIGRETVGNVISVLAALSQARGDTPEVAEAVEKARARAWRFAAAEFSDRFGIEDGMFFTHITFAFASYIDHVAQSSQTKDEARALFCSYRRLLLIAVAAVKPEVVKDPKYAAALALASSDGEQHPQQQRSGEKSHG